MNLTKKFTFLLIFTAIVACKPADEEQFLRKETSAYTSGLPPAKWANNSVFPINLQISTDFASEEASVIGNASTSWSESVDDSIQFFETSSSTTPLDQNLSSYKDSTYGVYKLTTWPTELPAMALAVTQIYGIHKDIGGNNERIEISHADILVNYEYFTFSTDDSWGYDLESVILHEMGHFLGLYHEENPSIDSVMYPTISRYNINRTPHEIDEENLNSKYIRNINSALNRLAVNTSDLEYSEEVVLQFELLANGKEQIKIKYGDRHEILNSKCNHHHNK